MRNLQYLTLIITCLTCCKSPGEKPSPRQQPSPLEKPPPVTLVAKDTPIPAAGVKAPPQIGYKTHLHDTTYVEGSFILFLHPNDARYDELESISEDVGDGDSDFGVGISNTMDSLKHNPQYSNIKGLTSGNRYIAIKDCLGGPIVIDRDSVNYGYIMSAKGRHIDSVLNSVHSGHYCQEIASYFFGKSD